jgi:CubicO group peptidase (beta-lactamase class C family)
MQELLDRLVRDGSERGLQLVAYRDGKLIVNVSSGVMRAGGETVNGDTLFPVFSVTKGVAATMAHILVEKGSLHYDTPIAELWPEFAANGKGSITLGHALSHTAGLPLMPLGLDHSKICNWDFMCDSIAGLTPVTAPGTKMAYHAVTYSWLVGEMVRRASGQSFEQVLADEICRPLGLKNLFVRIPDEVEKRVAVLDEVFEPGTRPPSAAAGQQRDVPSCMLPLHEFMNRSDARRACIPGSNGIMSAHDLARHYAALLPGGVDGVELLKPETIRQATIPRNPVPDPWDPKGYGYAMGGKSAEFGTRLNAFGHSGYGGATGFADPDYRLAIGLTKNLYSPRGATARIMKELRDALAIPH